MAAWTVTYGFPAGESHHSDPYASRTTYTSPCGRGVVTESTSRRGDDKFERTVRVHVDGGGIGQQPDVHAGIALAESYMTSTDPLIVKRLELAVAISQSNTLRPWTPEAKTAKARIARIYAELDRLTPRNQMVADTKEAA